MANLTAKEAREQFSRIIKAAERGERFSITRRGKPVACIGPAVQSEPKVLPKLGEFRNSLKVRGKSMCQTLLEARRQERY